MRSGEMEDGICQEPSFISDMSLEEMIYYFQQETQRLIRRMEDGKCELASTMSKLISLIYEELPS